MTDTINTYDHALSSMAAQQPACTEESQPITDFTVVPTQSRCRAHARIKQTCYKGCTFTPWSLMLGAMSMAQEPKAPRIAAYTALTKRMPDKLSSALRSLGTPGLAALEHLPEATKVLIAHSDQRRFDATDIDREGNSASRSEWTMCDAVAELEANSDKVAGEHQAAWDRIRKNLALHSPFEGAGRADNKQSEPLTTSTRDTTPPEVPPRFNPCPLHTYNGHSHLCLGRGRCNPTPLDSVYGIFSLTVNGTGRKTLEMRYIKSCLEGRRSKNPGSVSSDTPPTAEEIQAAEAHRTVTEQLGTLLFPQAESLARRNNKQRGEPSQGSKIIIEVAALMEMFRSNQRHHPEIETWFTIKEADADYTTTFKDRVAAVEAQITGDPLLFLCPSAEPEIDFMEQFDEDSQTSGGWQVDDDLVM